MSAFEAQNGKFKFSMNAFGYENDSVIAERSIYAVSRIWLMISNANAQLHESTSNANVSFLKTYTET